jgi:serine/threonine protein kinase
MRALYLIPQSPSPKLQKREAWSPEFHDFLDKCLTKDPIQRSSAVELLEVTFPSLINN